MPTGPKAKMFLIEQTKQIINLLETDIKQAHLNWMNLLTEYLFFKNMKNWFNFLVIPILQKLIVEMFTDKDPTFCIRLHQCVESHHHI